MIFKQFLTKKKKSKGRPYDSKTVLTKKSKGPPYDFKTVLTKKKAFRNTRWKGEDYKHGRVHDVQISSSVSYLDHLK